MKNYIILGNSNFTLSCARAILDSGDLISVIISDKNKPLNPADIKDFAERMNIDYYETDNINSQETITHIKKFNPDYIVSSWHKIIEKEILNIPKYYCIGTHPMDLPENGGRHPLHWAILLKHKSACLTFFKMNEEIDAGEILLKIPFDIDENDTINDLNEKVDEMGYYGMEMICSGRITNKPKLQNNSNINYLRKRISHDIIIDPRMSISMIKRIVNSFEYPYLCAKLIINDKIFKIKSVKEEYCNGFSNMEHGKVLNIYDKNIKIKVDDGIVCLELYEQIPQDLVNVNYIYPPTKYLFENKEKFVDLNI